MKTNEKGFIIELDDNEIFVFGSNIKGNHAGGAARQAFDDFGAEWGVGEGLTGQCYAFPTLNREMRQWGNDDLWSIYYAFERCVLAHPELTFYLTPVGTGIAGYEKNIMNLLFTNIPNKVHKVCWS